MNSTRLASMLQRKYRGSQSIHTFTLDFKTTFIVHGFPPITRGRKCQAATKVRLHTFMLLDMGFALLRVWALLQGFFPPRVLALALLMWFHPLWGTCDHTPQRGFLLSEAQFRSWDLPHSEEMIAGAVDGIPHSGTMSHTYLSVPETIQPDYSRDYQKHPALWRGSGSKTIQQSNTGKINKIALISNMHKSSFKEFTLQFLPIYLITSNKWCQATPYFSVCFWKEIQIHLLPQCQHQKAFFGSKHLR